METNMDTKAIQKAAHASPTAEIVSKMLSERRRQRGIVKLSHTRMELMRQNLVIDEQDYNKFWIDLESAGVGRVINGRNKKPNEFRFNYNLIEVGRIAVDGKVTPKIVLRKAPQNLIKTEDNSKVLETNTDKVTSSEVMIFIPLRDDYRISFKVPSNLTREERKVIVESLHRVTF